MSSAEGSDELVLRLSKRRLRRLAGGAISLLLVIAGVLYACNRDPEPPFEINALDACGQIESLDPDLGRTAGALCNSPLTDDELVLLKIRECPADLDQAAILTDTGAQGEGEFIFLSEMMVRFHPVDEFEDLDAIDAADAYDTGLDPSIMLPENQIWIIDFAGHGKFAASVVTAMLGLDRDVDVTELDGGDLADELVAKDLSGPVLLVDVPTFDGIEVGRVVSTEQQIADVLQALHRSDAVNKENMIVNMSLGAYTCGVTPEVLEEALVDLSKHGATFVASAGNDEAHDLPYPAAWAVDHPVLADVLTSVGSLTSEEGPRSCFSNYGDDVEVWRVGEEVLGHNGQGEGSWSGTSFAAPQVSALISAGEEIVAAWRGKTPADPPGSFDVLVEVDRGNSTEEIPVSTSCEPGGGYLPAGVKPGP